MCEAVLKCPNIVVFCIGSIILLYLDNGADESTKSRYSNLLKESRKWEDLWI